MIKTETKISNEILVQSQSVLKTILLQKQTLGKKI